MSRPSSTASIPGLRERLRADGTLRRWWEPNAKERAVGCIVVELDSNHLGHARRVAQQLRDDAQKRLAGTAPKTKGTARTMAALIAEYRRARQFKDRPATTRRSYETNLRAIEDKWGPELVIGFGAAACNTWYETLLAAKGSFRARALLRMMSILFSYAELLEWREAGSNPVAPVKMKTPPSRSRACTWEELDALLDAADRLQQPMLALIVLLGIYGGQRVTDVIEARPDHFSQIPMGRKKTAKLVWVWSVVQSKTGKAVAVPIHDDVTAALEAQLARVQEGPGTLVWASTGKPFTGDAMAAAWSRLRAEAATTCPGIASLTQRDLRRSFSNHARAGAATEGDIADVLGNTADKNSALRQVYMAPQLVTATRAVQAVRKPTERKQG